MSGKRNFRFRQMKPPPRTPTYDDLLAIVRLIESGSRFSEFRLRSGDIEVDIKRTNDAAREPVITGAADAAMAGDPIGPEPPGLPTAGAGSAAVAAAGATIPELVPGTHVIRSPMVGTFYRAPDPGAPPFVEEGTHVKPDTIVGMIEVMKLMNSVTAGISGVVTHVLAENAHMVEFGQPLVAIKPDRGQIPRQAKS